MGVVIMINVTHKQTAVITSAAAICMQDKALFPCHAAIIHS